MKITSVWAKTNYDDSRYWMSLYQHLEDTYRITQMVWDYYLPETTRRLVIKEFGEEELARSMVTFLSALHDLGKSSPAFVSQGPDHLVSLAENSISPIPDGVRSRELRHEVTSHYALSEWLQERGWSYLDTEPFCVCLIGHHGLFRTAQLSNLFEGRTNPHYGDEEWRKARTETINNYAEKFGISDNLHAYKEVQLSKQAQSIITGIIVMSDWISSNTDLFPLSITGESEENNDERAELAWENLGIPSPWKKKGNQSPEEIFTERFSLPENARMRPVQKLMSDIAETITDPSLIILEAPMGVGKTEAALLAAEIIAKNNGQGGLLFALPTMATTNGIFPRIKSWMDTALDGRSSITLKHSKSHLHEDYSMMSYTHNGGNSQVVHWFSGKKSLLSHFVITTIDNVLFTSLKHKYFVLNHLGLSGKIVVVDEVHAADSYMSVFLENSLRWLSSMGVTVILLSATLPAEQRASLVKAYGEKKQRRRRRGQQKEYHPLDERYPLVTVTDYRRKTSTYTVEDDSKDATIRVDLHEGDIMELLNEIDEGNVAVIVNTVGQAQEIYKEVIESGLFPSDEVTLFHSRFLADERLRREEQLLKKMGKNGDRPHRSITIATQVIEQSLDLDFDGMITEIAPIDLILQRSGRMHRHSRGRPEAFSEPVLTVTGFEQQDGSTKFGRGSSMIYTDFLLDRTLNVLTDHPTISIPGDIPLLIHEVYGMDGEYSGRSPELLENYQDRIERSRRKAELFTLPTPTSSGTLLGSNEITKNSEEQGRAAVRDSQDSLEVIVLQRTWEGDLIIMNEYEDILCEDTEPDWRTVKKILGKTVSLPYAVTRSMNESIRILEETGYIDAWQTNPFLKGQLIMILDEENSFSFKEHVVIYDENTGLTVKKGEVNE